MSEEEDQPPGKGGWALDWGRLGVVYLLGKMGCGKSTAIEAIVRQSAATKTHSWVVCFSPTTHGNSFGFLPDEAIHAFSVEKFLGIYRQIAAYKDRCKAEKKKPKLSRGLIILSDCVGLNSRLMFQPEFVNAFISSRHYGPIDLIIDSQVYTGVPPTVRNLASHVLIWRTRGTAQTKQLHTFAGGGCENHKEFKKLLDVATEEPHSCLVYTAAADTREEMYQSFTFQYPIPPFKLRFKLPFTI